ncbi:MAG TPA: hypothetical protein VGJ05_07695 [Fimbriiglobus sp.]|jgi:hypothetical protein
MTKNHEPTIFELVRDPAIRTAAFVTAACGLVAFGALFLFRGPVAAGIPTAFAVYALLLRAVWPVGVYIISVAFLLFMPDGTPITLGSQTTFMVRNGGFALSDMMLVAAVLTYVIAQYRFLGLTRQALPFDADSSFGRKDGAVRRPATLQADREVKWLVGSAVAAMAFGQLVWYVLAHVQFDFLLTLPLRWVPDYGRDFEGISIGPALNRFVLLALAGMVAAGTGRLVFWYWGLLRLSREEAVATVTDAGWHEARRELATQEKRRGAAKAEADRRGLLTEQLEGAP